VTVRIDGVQPGTFVALEYDYAADSARVYYEGKPLTNDPQSFRVLQLGYAASGDRVYYYGAPVADADPLTFAILDAPTDSADARDAKARYQQGRRTSAPAAR
jgi:DKNYY family